MPLNRILISDLNPLKWVKVGRILPEVFNQRFFQDWLQYETLNEVEEPMIYRQPWQSADIIPLRVLANYGPLRIELYTCTGLLVDTFVMDYTPSSIEASGYRAYTSQISMDDYPEGGYFFRMFCGDPVLEVWESEAIDLKARHTLSILMQYTHFENDYDCVFEDGFIFRARIPGAFTTYQPGTKRVVFIDAEQVPHQTSAMRFSTYRHIVGTEFGVPDWVADRVTNIYLCSKVSGDGLGVAANDSPLEPTREDNVPFVGWAQEVRVTDNSISRAGAVDANLDGTTTVVYNIDKSRGFGGISTPTGTNVVQIENLD